MAAVTNSPDFQRVRDLPRRVNDPAEVAQWAAELTEIFRAPFGTQTLLDTQAEVLVEAVQNRGVVNWASVGGGKTIPSFLLPKVLEAERPVLVLPGSHIHDDDIKPGRPPRGKAAIEFDKLSKHWQFGRRPYLLSYETVGHPDHRDILEELNPDLVILDEAHHLANAKCARTRRFHRFFKSHPDCVVCALDGSPFKRHIADFAHIVRWCLHDRAPVPLSNHVLEEWDGALAEQLSAVAERTEPGALAEWSDGLTDLRSVRRGYQRRLRETPGMVVYSVPASAVPVRLIITEHRLTAPEAGPVDLAFQKLRTLAELPDGTQLVEGLEIYRHARSLGLGFWLRWRDPAPEIWLARRKAWGSFVRAELVRSSTLDSPEDVARANPDCPELLQWREIRKSYEPVTVAEWIDLGAVRYCNDWLSAGGVAITEHTVFGQMLAKLAGVPFFGPGGLDEAGRSIEHYTGQALVASCGANREGRNLQRYNRMLVASPLPNGPGWEQLLGRLHRRFQERDVEITLLVSSLEGYSAAWQADLDSRAAEDLIGNAQKLVGAELTLTADGSLPYTAQWVKDWSAEHIQHHQ
jgi:hypothetical protein